MKACHFLIVELLSYLFTLETICSEMEVDGLVVGVIKRRAVSWRGRFSMVPGQVTRTKGAENFGEQCEVDTTMTLLITIAPLLVFKYDL